MTLFWKYPHTATLKIKRTFKTALKSKIIAKNRVKNAKSCQVAN